MLLFCHLCPEVCAARNDSQLPISQKPVDSIVGAEMHKAAATAPAAAVASYALEELAASAQ